MTAAQQEEWDLEPLQILSVSRHVRQKYFQPFRAFRPWFAHQGSSFGPSARFDHFLAKSASELFHKGEDLREGQKLLAAVKLALPQYGKLGAIQLPRST